jgi:hypothetical protein
MVTLTPGLTVSLDALKLLWDLEARNCIIRLDGGQLLIGPRTILTDGDRAGIRQHRDELIALVRHCEAIQ